MTKATYKSAQNKKAVREFLFNYFSYNAIVGLAGPDINDYIEWCKSKGYEDFEIWEMEPSVMLSQIKQVKHPVKYKFGNILNSTLRENTLFDLDYCTSVRYMKEHIQKFRDNFIMTFSTRIGVEETIKSFFSFRNESLKAQLDITGPGNKNVLFVTENSKYLFITYFDTSAMCCFAKIN